MSKILLSGIQPSGKPHIGNYFGAMKQFVDMQDTHESYILIVDYHALTTIHDAETLSQNIFDLTADYLAVGLDPEKVALYRQSDVPEVTELMWILSTLITVPYLQRAHAYKDKVARGIEPTAGLFNYPVLMAADILLPRAELVPVGQDQKQHIEITRDIAEKFNATYGETFPLPEEYIQESVAVVPGIDGQKMSKSYGNHIPLFAEQDELEKLVMSIVTDSAPVDEPKDPEKDVAYALHKLFTPQEQLLEVREGYEKGGLSYADSKKILLQNMNSYLEPLREKRAKLLENPEIIHETLEKGAQKARKRTEQTIDEVRKKVGLFL